MADLVAIEGRDRDFQDALPGKVELNNDVCVEVEIVELRSNGIFCKAFVE